MEGVKPIMNMGQTRWYKKIKQDATYAIALDPAMGTGGDYAAIQCLNIQAMNRLQSGDNTTHIAQIRILTI